MPDEPIKLAIEALEYHTAQTRPISKTERALAALHSIKPDCRTCQHKEPLLRICTLTVRKGKECVGGDKYQARPIIQLYLKK
jgi:hypothetical protein